MDVIGIGILMCFGRLYIVLFFGYYESIEFCFIEYVLISECYEAARESNQWKNEWFHRVDPIHGTDGTCFRPCDASTATGLNLEGSAYSTEAKAKMIDELMAELEG